MMPQDYAKIAFTLACGAMDPDDYERREAGAFNLAAEFGRRSIVRALADLFRTEDGYFSEADFLRMAEVPFA
jgi:hypothetical protein